MKITKKKVLILTLVAVTIIFIAYAYYDSLSMYPYPTILNQGISDSEHKFIENIFKIHIPEDAVFQIRTDEHEINSFYGMYSDEPALPDDLKLTKIALMVDMLIKRDKIENIIYEIEGRAAAEEHYSFDSSMIHPRFFLGSLNKLNIEQFIKMERVLTYNIDYDNHVIEKTYYAPVYYYITKRTLRGKYIYMWTFINENDLVGYEDIDIMRFYREEHVL